MMNKLPTKIDVIVSDVAVKEKHGMVGYNISYFLSANPKKFGTVYTVVSVPKVKEFCTNNNLNYKLLSEFKQPNPKGDK